MTKSIWTYITVAVVVVLLTVLASRGYYKSLESKLVGGYEQVITKNNKMIADYSLAQAEYERQLDADSVELAKVNLEVSKLKAKANQQAQELVAAKETIKKFTAGEAIKFFTDYTKSVDSRMLVEKADTALVISLPTVKVADGIFAEHKSLGLQVVTLGQLLTTKDKAIALQANDLAIRQKQLDLKDGQIALNTESCNARVSSVQLDADKYRSQRNKARWFVAGETAFIVATVFKLISAK